MKHLLILLTAMSMSYVSQAQNPGKVTGSIKDGGNQKVIDAASTSLLKVNDSSLVKTAIVDKEGNFIFENIKEGSYLVIASSIGHMSVYSRLFTISPAQTTIDVGVLQLLPVSKNLKEVVVSSKKQLIERKVDRTIVNVDASITNSGATAMDVLEKSPGVTVDKDGNISLKGKQGVIIMLDGKPSYLNATDLANLLKTTPALNLDQVEIMTNPSAKYDAAGKAGIINIKTKKNKQKGFNGSLNSSYGQGVYAKNNNSLNLNYRTGKLNLYSNASVNYWKGFQRLDIYRRYKNADGSLNAIFEQVSNMLHYNQNYGAKIGADFYATKKTTFGIVLTGFSSPDKQDGSNTSLLKGKTGVTDSIVASSSNENSSWKNGAVNLNFRHQFDSTGRELTADIDYISYKANKSQVFTNKNYTSNWLLKTKEELAGELPAAINIYSAKVDYSHPLKNGLKIEAGVKSSYVKTDNTAGYFTIEGLAKLPDYEKTNHFIYQENINAAYINFNKEFKKWGVQAGLRLENTNYNGKQFGNPQRRDSSFKNTYTGLFPTLFVSYNQSEKNQFGFSYGRRISRPNYDDLNPFLFFLDKYTYGAGNPFLRPSYANTFEVSHTFRQFLTTTINYSNTKDLFSDVFEQKGYASIVKKGNFGRSNSFSASVSAQLPVVKWWTAVLYGEFNNSEYKGLLNAEYVDLQGSNFLVNCNNQFKFNKGWSAELSGFYRTKGIEGQIQVNPIGQISAGIQKQVLKSKGTLKFNVRDIFYTQPASGDINFQRTEAFFRERNDSRVATIGFSYRFGKPVGGASKRKTGGAGEEQNRVKVGN